MDNWMMLELETIYGEKRYAIYDSSKFKGNEGEEEPLEIYFLEMQHIYADSIFIKKGNVEVLIDAGWEYDGNYVDKVLTQYCTDDRLDLFMVSHSDGDHIDGVANALKNVDNIGCLYLKLGELIYSSFICFL